MLPSNNNQNIIIPAKKPVLKWDRMSLFDREALERKYYRELPLSRKACYGKIGGLGLYADPDWLAVGHLIAEGKLSLQRAANLNENQCRNLRLDSVQHLIRTGYFTIIEQAIALDEKQYSNLASKEIKKLSSKGIISIQEVIELTENQRLNLESQAVQQLLVDKRISLPEAKELTENQRLNLESQAVQQLLVDKRISFPEAKELTENQRISLSSRLIQLLIEKKMLSIEEAMTLSSRQRVTLEVLADLISKGILTIKRSLELSKTQCLYIVRPDIDNLIKTKKITIEEAIELASVGELSDDAHRPAPAACLQDHPKNLEILLNAQHSHMEIDLSGSCKQVAGRRNLDCQQQLDNHVDPQDITLEQDPAIQPILHLIQEKLLTIEQAKKLNPQELLNIQLFYVQDFIRRKVLPVELAVKLDQNQYLNLNSPYVMSLVRTNVLTIEEALAYTPEQRNRIESTMLEPHLTQKRKSCDNHTNTNTLFNHKKPKISEQKESNASPEIPIQHHNKSTWFEPKKIQLNSATNKKNWGIKNHFKYLDSDIDSLQHVESKLYVSKLSMLSNTKDKSYGVFTTANISKHTLLGCYKGQKIQYDPNKKEHEYTFVDADKNEAIDAKSQRNWTAFMNSTTSFYTANVLFLTKKEYADYCCETGFQADKNTLDQINDHERLVIAIADIRQDQQLMPFYGHGYAFNKHFRFLNPNNSEQDSKEIYNNHQHHYELTCLHKKFKDLFKLFSFEKDIDNQLFHTPKWLIEENILALDDKNYITEHNVDIPLLEMAADDTVIQQKDQENLTSLMLACWSGETDRITHLLSKSANPDRQTSISGYTALHLTIKAPIANSRTKTSIITQLIAHSSRKALLILQDKNKKSALHWAIDLAASNEKGSLEIMDILLVENQKIAEKNNDIAIYESILLCRDQDDNDPLSYCLINNAKEGALKIIEYLTASDIQDYLRDCDERSDHSPRKTLLSAFDRLDPEHHADIIQAFVNKADEFSPEFSATEVACIQSIRQLEVLESRSSTRLS